jgi:hypothetical protein
MHPFNKVIINSSKTNQFATHNKLLRKARTNEMRYVVNSNAQNMKFNNSQIWYHVQWINDKQLHFQIQVSLQEHRNSSSETLRITQTQKHSAHTATLTTHGHHEPGKHCYRVGWHHIMDQSSHDLCHRLLPLGIDNVGNKNISYEED